MTDICMPVMDGLELAAYVHEHYPETKVMIISGYDEFDYAKRAMKYGVSEYVLKPITSEELKDELIHIREKLDQDSGKRIRIEQMKKEYEKSRPLVREHFLDRVLEGTESKEEISAQNENFGEEFSGTYQAVMLVGTIKEADWKDIWPDISEQLMNFIIFNITEVLLENDDHTLVFRNHNDRCVVVFARDSRELLHKAECETGEKLLQAFAKNINLHPVLAVGKSVSSPQYWNISYEDAKHVAS